MMCARVHPQPAPEAERRRSRRCCHCRQPEQKEKIMIPCFAFTILAVCGGFGTLAVLDTMEPLYSFAVAAVTGLDPEADLGRAALNPEFNLTLRITSRGPVSGACLKPG
ncbi:hypothetical protein BAE44_0010486 [Dichanthelium oligosanthes]|uniref:Uncharacterized protein n=1 Tax=Dichanthelium oligosanthes TaxID=888268 RepID=A0A1E5VTQ2_9POAL|nr:hypothetical protein BAE44_0010486 [Dichanthelium oligosanthes]